MPCVHGQMWVGMRRVQEGPGRRARVGQAWASTREGGASNVEDGTWAACGKSAREARQ